MTKIIPEMTEMYSKNMDSYFKKYGVKSIEELSFDKKRELFYDAIKGFYDKEVNVYDLAEIGSHVWESLSDEEKKSELGDVAMSAQEVEHYLHSESIDTLAGFLKSIKEASNSSKS